MLRFLLNRLFIKKCDLKYYWLHVQRVLMLKDFMQYFNYFFTVSIKIINYKELNN